MLKLYKSNYTTDDLFAMAEHCQRFCPVLSNDRLGEGCLYCVYYRICRDFQLLGEYCLEKANNG